MNYKQQSIDFWNQQFQDIAPITIQPEDVKIEHKLDEYLSKLGSECTRVLDIGCGMGNCLLGCHLLGAKHPEGLGLDASHHAIHFAQETIKLSSLPKLQFVEGDETYLESIASNSYDGVVCSNFLDVIPHDIAIYVVQQIRRILAPKGYFLLKINFYLTEELIQKLQMVPIETNTYAMKGIIRAYNMPTEEWCQLFSGWTLLETDGFQRAPHLPPDRILYFQKP
ncbi:MAG: class I SAM-dependent methyltransferase [Bacilli bacterium]|nr:class I SAM-dependent methyltransferase [Bacilli bacterium]